METFCFSGSTNQVELNRTALEGLPVKLIRLEEQNTVATILSTLDRAIEQTEEIIAKQQRIKTGLMQDLLTKGIDELGVIRSEATHEFKDSPLGRIPVEWEVAPMVKYGAKNRPYLRTGPFGSALNTKHWVAEGVPVFTIGSLGEGVVLENELLYVSEQTASLLINYRVERGDIVFSRVADVGRALVVSEQQVGWIISSNFMRISLDLSAARPLFLYRNIAFNSAIHSQLRTASNAGGRDLVNGCILSGLIFPWPHLEEQDRINNAVASIDATINVAKAQLANFQSTKAGLMHDLLTGTVRVANP
jgi:type I restriction enzyme S subunit